MAPEDTERRIYYNCRKCRQRKPEVHPGGTCTECWRKENESSTVAPLDIKRLRDMLESGESWDYDDKTSVLDEVQRLKDALVDCWAFATLVPGLIGCREVTTLVMNALGDEIGPIYARREQERRAERENNG